VGLQVDATAYFFYRCNMPLSLESESAASATAKAETRDCEAGQAMDAVKSADRYDALTTQVMCTGRLVATHNY